MSNADDPHAQTDQEIAAANLERVAHQFVTTIEGIPSGDATQEILRAARARLQAAAIAYCQAHGHPPPA